MDAGLAKAAHTEQHDLEARRLGGIRAADVRAAVAVEDGRGLVRPVARERLDRPRLHAALFAGPLRRLRDAVLAAEDVVAEFVEAVGVRVDVFLLVKILRQPDVGDGQLQRHVRVRQDGDPLVRVDGRAVVEVGADVDALDAQLRQIVAQAAGHMRHDAERRDLRVAAPEEQKVGVLGDVRVEVGLRRHLADGLAAPDVLRAPEPALPRVHVAHLQGVAAHEREQPVRAAVARGDVLALAVHIGLAEHGLGAVGRLHAQELLCDDLRRLVPADADVFRLAAVFRMALAVRIPVHALQGVFHAVGRVHARLVAEAERRDRHAVGRLKCFAAGLYFPRVAVRLRVFLVVEIRADPRDPPVGGVHLTGRAALRPHKGERDDVLLVRLEFNSHDRITSSLFSDLSLPCAHGSRKQ